MHIKQFGIVDIFTYFVPGVIFLFAIRMSKYFDVLEENFSFENSTIEIFLLVLASYIVGHMLHFPSVLIGRLINKIFGSPTRFLADPNEGHTSSLTKYLRSDFPLDHKQILRDSLDKHWQCREHLGVDVSRTRHYALCEILVEEYHPNSWMIHERFYSAANMSRAMIIPMCILAVVVWDFSWPLSVALGISCFLSAYRYYTLNVTAIKQIYDTFYLHFLKGQ